MGDYQADALLQHLISRVHQDVQLLADLGHIDRQAADSFLVNLPNSQQIAHPTPNAVAFPVPTPSAMPAAVKKAPPPPAPKPVRTQARALWAYNEKGTEKNDLSFSAGDIIEVIDETNEDWWTGRVHGKEGLFPSNHVEKMDSGRTLPPAAPVTTGRPYKPFGAAYHGLDQPPAAQNTVNAVGLQEHPKNEEKKSKFGGLKNTMAHSAAGGVGFGAGAAIGSGIVNAIF
jgi:hypothetical protein